MYDFNPKSKDYIIIIMWVVGGFPPTLLFLLKYHMFYGLLINDFIPMYLSILIIIINTYLVLAYGKIMTYLMVHQYEKPTVYLYDESEYQYEDIGANPFYPKCPRCGCKYPLNKGIEDRNVFEEFPNLADLTRCPRCKHTFLHDPLDDLFDPTLPEFCGDRTCNLCKSPLSEKWDPVLCANKDLDEPCSDMACDWCK